MSNMVKVHCPIIEDYILSNFCYLCTLAFGKNFFSLRRRREPKKVIIILGSVHGWGTTFGTKELRIMSHWISTFIMIYDYLINKF